MHSDPIADLATRIRNAAKAGHSTVTIPHSKVKELIVRVLHRFHFVENIDVVSTGSFEEIVLTLSPEKKELTIKRLSKPGRRLYVKAVDIKPVRSGKGISVISTSEGVMAGFEAYKKGLGGELMLEVY